MAELALVWFVDVFRILRWDRNGMTLGLWLKTLGFPGNSTVNPDFLCARVTGQDLCRFKSLK